MGQLLQERTAIRNGAGCRIALLGLTLATYFAPSKPISANMPWMRHVRLQGAALTRSELVEGDWSLLAAGSPQRSLHCLRMRGGSTEWEGQEGLPTPLPPSRGEVGATGVERPESGRKGGKEGGAGRRGRGVGPEEREYVDAAAAAFDLTYPALLSRLEEKHSPGPGAQVSDGPELWVGFAWGRGGVGRVLLEELAPVIPNRGTSLIRKRLSL